MALNKFMHPRNIYRNPPDFDKLSKRYPEFCSVSKTDVLGKVRIDFKDPNSLRILTKCLLKSDFNLEIEIPEDRLVPTLPLRLNYILWIEDLLQITGNEESVCGLDIGTGACAIYPLLAAVKNKWPMIGSETDDKSITVATENVQRNNLQHLVTIVKNPTASLLNYIFTGESERQFHFCMCNPPFYSSMHELYDSRSPARPEPKNGFTGSPHELITEGGELEFCRKLIKESLSFCTKIRIFTTMVGHKSNLKELCLNLQEQGIKYTSTEFCQGRVTRWGLAWTFLDYNLYELLPPREKLRKKPYSMTYVLPKLHDTPYDVDTVLKKLVNIFDDLKIKHKTINKRLNTISLDFISYENTWSNQRRKRRLLKRLTSESSKKIKMNDNGSSVDQTELIGKPLPSTEDSKCENESKETEESTCTKTKVIVHSLVKIVKKDPDIFLELEFLDGVAGKEGLHQIVQYIKNCWN